MPSSYDDVDLFGLDGVGDLGVVCPSGWYYDSAQAKCVQGAPPPKPNRSGSLGCPEDSFDTYDPRFCYWPQNKTFFARWGSVAALPVCSGGAKLFGNNGPCVNKDMFFNCGHATKAGWAGYLEPDGRCYLVGHEEFFWRVVPEPGAVWLREKALPNIMPESGPYQDGTPVTWAPPFDLPGNISGMHIPLMNGVLRKATNNFTSNTDAGAFFLPGWLFVDWETESGGLKDVGGYSQSKIWLSITNYLKAAWPADGEGYCINPYPSTPPVRRPYSTGSPTGSKYRALEITPCVNKVTGAETFSKLQTFNAFWSPWYQALFEDVAKAYEASASEVANPDDPTKMLSVGKMVRDGQYPAMIYKVLHREHLNDMDAIIGGRKGNLYNDEVAVYWFGNQFYYQLFKPSFDADSSLSWGVVLNPFWQLGILPKAVGKIFEEVVDVIEDLAAAVLEIVKNLGCNQAGKLAAVAAGDIGAVVYKGLCQTAPTNTPPDDTSTTMGWFVLGGAVVLGGLAYFAMRKTP